MTGRRWRWVLVLLAVGFLVTGGAWAVSSAPGSSPDENFHLASVWCAWGQEAAGCRPTGHITEAGRAEVELPWVLADVSCMAFDRAKSAACQFEALARGGRGLALADAGQYPGLFYATMRLFVGDSVATSVVAMRLFNVLLATVLILGAVVLAGHHLRRAVALVWLVVLVPVALFLIASVNPSGWAIVGVGTCWAYLLALLRTEPTERWRSWAAGAGALVAAVVASGARSDAAAYVALSALAVVGFAVRGPRGLRDRRLLVPLAVVLLAAAAFLTAGQSSAVGGLGEEVDPNRSPVYVLLNNVLQLPLLLAGTVGYGWGLGWLDTPMPAAVETTGPAVLFGALLLGIGVLWRRKAVVVAALAFAVAAVPLFILQRRLLIVGEQVQPRYVLPLAIVAVGFAVLGRPGRPVRPTAVQAAVLGLVVTGANAVALHTNLRRYVSGLDVGFLDLNQLNEWWWDLPGTSPMGVWVVGTAGGLLLFGALALLARGPADPQGLDLDQQLSQSGTDQDTNAVVDHDQAGGGQHGGGQEPTASGSGSSSSASR